MSVQGDRSQGPEQWTEYRAVYQRPASILNTTEEREQGYVEERTLPYRTIREATEIVNRNSAESHAGVTGYERRQVQATGWEQI